jgi:hypothetical protein
MGHENSYQIAIKSLFWPKCWIACYNTQEATYTKLNKKIQRANDGYRNSPRQVAAASKTGLRA